jgi:hypothetical protein
VSRSTRGKNRKARDVLERDVDRAFVRAAKRAGLVAVKLTGGAHGSLLGLPDRLVLGKGGRCAFVEMKKPGEGLSELQKKTRKALERRGYDVDVLDDPADVGRLVYELTGELL